MNILAATLANPASAIDLGNAHWEQLLGELRRARMLARLDAVLRAHCEEQSLPLAARELMRSDAIYVANVQRAARQELGRLASIAQDVDYPVILLKGSAYLEAGLTVARGRRQSDLDVLVPESALDDFEQRLRQAGWRFDADLSAYDERYYREWAHELPPMRHSRSAMELDVHHNLIQQTSRVELHIGPVLAAAHPLPDTPFHVLCNEDLVLHSALHLLMSDELRGGIRDLYDIHCLCVRFTGEDTRAWQGLVDRARTLGLQRPLYYALAAARELFGLQVPTPAWRTLCADGRPGFLADKAMRRLMQWHFAPAPDQPGRAAVALELLYLRSHWIRMPPGMLVRHLAYKWAASLRGWRRDGTFLSSEGSPRRMD